MFSLDTETTGIDFRHGARPFLVVTCGDDGETRIWEWPVDPLTRDVLAPEDEIDDIGQYVRPSGTGSRPIVFQNARFDVTALATLRPEFGKWWEWDRTHDTLLLVHVLESNRLKNLTALAVRWLHTDIEPFERRLADAVKHARRVAKSRFPDWATANEDRADMPSVGADAWRCDYWLPKALADAGDETAMELGWGTVLREYAEADAVVTVRLFEVMSKEVKRRGYWPHYEQRRKCLRIAYEMEDRGVTYSKSRLDGLLAEYGAESCAAEKLCVGIAASYGYDLKMPKSGSNKLLDEFLGAAVADEHAKGNVESVVMTPTGRVATSKAALEHLELQLPERSRLRMFVRTLRGKRKRDTAVSYMESYSRFSLPWGNPVVDRTAKALVNAIRKAPLDEAANAALQDYLTEVPPVEGTEFYVLHPNLNITGTDTLRWSSSNPNEQNISKQEGFNLRHAFGPAPGREWWSLDAKNIELRIPFYVSGETELIALFERPDDPPYYGSNHLLNFHTVYPDLWEKETQLLTEGFKIAGSDDPRRDAEAKVGPHCKKKYAATWYQWCKNGGFAIQYNAGRATADRAFHRAGAFDLLKSRFANLEKLNRRCIDQANRWGYVETLPDKTLGCRKGYPLLCTRTDRGTVLETVPLSYFVQGSAMYWTMKAMIRVDEFFGRLNDGAEFEGRTWPGGYHIALQVHDELVPDMPSGAGRGEQSYSYNLPVVREVQRLMALGGDDIGVPTPVGIEYHESTWAEGITL